LVGPENVDNSATAGFTANLQDDVNVEKYVDNCRRADGRRKCEKVAKVVFGIMLAVRDGVAKADKRRAPNMRRFT
jgi:hypothetical protein